MSNMFSTFATDRTHPESAESVPRRTPTRGRSDGERISDRELLRDLAQLEDVLRIEEPTGLERTHVHQRIADISHALADNRKARRGRRPQNGRW